MDVAKQTAARWHAVEIDILVEAGDWPEEAELGRLTDAAMDALTAELDLKPAQPVELSIVFSDDAHVRVLNAEWRGKDSATNVLSFPAFPDASASALPPMLGDIILAAETVAREATLEGKPLAHHITHLLVHGFLHLVGHDHLDEDEAEEMEALERRVLARLAIPDPYA